MAGGRVTVGDLHCVPCDEEDGSLCCPRITFHGKAGCVEVVMGDAQGGVLVPSADNVAVLHPGTSLPWLSAKDWRTHSHADERSCHLGSPRWTQAMYRGCRVAGTVPRQRR